MCDTAQVNTEIIRASKYSYACHIESLSTGGETVLAKVNRRADRLYNQLHAAFLSITEEDYVLIRPYLLLFINTLNDLYKSKISLDLQSSVELSALQSNISALQELDADIQNFRINIFKNPKYKEVMVKLRKQ